MGKLVRSKSEKDRKEYAKVSPISNSAGVELVPETKPRSSIQSYPN